MLLFHHIHHIHHLPLLILLLPTLVPAINRFWYPTTVTELSPSNFTSLVLQAGGRPSFVHFYAAYSNHCNVLRKSFDLLALNFSSATSPLPSSSSGSSSISADEDQNETKAVKAPLLLIGRADTYVDEPDSPSAYGAKQNELYKYVRGGHPTIMWFNGVDDTPVEYEGPRYVDEMASFIYEMSGIEPRPAVVDETSARKDEL